MPSFPSMPDDALCREPGVLPGRQSGVMLGPPGTPNLPMATRLLPRGNTPCTPFFTRRLIPTFTRRLSKPRRGLIWGPVLNTCK